MKGKTKLLSESWYDAYFSRYTSMRSKLGNFVKIWWKSRSFRKTCALLCLWLLRVKPHLLFTIFASSSIILPFEWHQLTLISSFWSQVRRVFAKPYQICVQKWLLFTETREPRGLRRTELGKNPNFAKKRLVGNYFMRYWFEREICWNCYWHG